MGEAEVSGSAERSGAEFGSEIIRIHAIIGDHAELLGNVVAVPLAFDIGDFGVVMAHHSQLFTVVRCTGRRAIH